MGAEVAETDDIAREHELYDFVVVIFPARVVAQRAALDAIELHARVARLEQHFSTVEATQGDRLNVALGAHSGARAGRARGDPLEMANA
jgi:hypothetical protein